METLSISVQEVVTVKDIVGFVFRVLKAVFGFIKPEPPQKPLQPVAESKDNKSPPDLGIAVGDGIKVGEALG